MHLSDFIWMACEFVIQVGGNITDKGNSDTNDGLGFKRREGAKKFHWT